MARTALTPQNITKVGIAPTYGAPDAAGSIIPGDGRTFLHFKNTGAVLTVTVQTAYTPPGETLVAHTKVVPATTGDVMIGPFEPWIFNRASGVADPGTVYIDYTAVAGLTVACLTLGA